MRSKIKGLAITLLLACNNNSPRYFPPEAPLETTASMGEVTATIEVPFRRPTEDERKEMQEKSEALGFAVPFLRRDNLDVSIQYTITNLSPNPGTAQVVVNGANEYTSYDLAAVRAFVETLVLPDNDEVALWSLVNTTPVVVPGGATISGNIREDDVVEAARDLDAMGRWEGPYLSLLLNRSQVNPLGMEKVPRNVVLPQLYKYIVSFSASQPMRLDFLVRVRDKEDLLAEGDEPRYRPEPKPFQPTIEGAVPAMMGNNNMMGAAGAMGSGGAQGMGGAGGSMGMAGMSGSGGMGGRGGTGGQSGASGSGGMSPDAGVGDAAL